MIRRFREVSRVFLCWDPVDFRKNITGLAGIVQYNFDEDLYSGSLFVFTNRSKIAQEKYSIATIQLDKASQFIAQWYHSF